MQRTTLTSIAVLAALGGAAAGCGDKSARVVTVPASSAAPASSGSGSSSGSQPFPGPSGGAPVSSGPGGGGAPVGSASQPAPSPSPAPNPNPAPAPTPGAPSPGGYSVAPAQPLPAPTRAITVGQGPVLATTARGDVFELGRDWEARDLRALDPRDARLSGDGLRDSRELIAFYSRRENGTLYLRLDLHDLQYGAELGGLDLAFLIGWPGAIGTGAPLGLNLTLTTPYGAAFVVRDTADHGLYDPTGGPALLPGAPGLELAFRSDQDLVEAAIPESALTALGWAGQPLTFQVLSVKDGDSRPHDAVLEVDLLDRQLDQVVHEGWVADRAAKLSLVLVGNRAALSGSYLSDLIYSTNTRTAEGVTTGLLRTLESHTAHDLPVNVHLSGVLANAIGWAKRGNDPRQDGAWFLARVAEFFDGDRSNGEGGFLPGLYVDNMMPFFAGAPNQRFIAQAQEVYAERLGVTQPGPVFWTPERVIGGGTFAELTQAGFTHTVIDRTHLDSWFGAQVTDGKLHRVNGVDCFVIDPSVSVFQEGDGGASADLRELLVSRALDPDGEQVIVLAADWEEYAGHKGNSNVPDSYDRVLAWLSQRPWVEVVTLEDVAARGWTPVDHGLDPNLPTETYEWLRHACEERYEHWYYGHPLEQSFAALQPPIRYGRPHARQIGDVSTPGTLFGDTWSAIQTAPQGALRELAERAFSSALYRTAWHQEDMHDTRRLATGDYVNPDSTYDQISGFVYALSTHAGEAAITARAARWAANPPGVAQTGSEDVDLDGEPEYLLMDDTMLLVFERDGGRLTAGFVRDANSGQGYQVIGDPMAFPSRSPEVGYEDDFTGAARNSALKDVYYTGSSRGYVNDGAVAVVSTTSVGLSFTSSDGNLRKTISWADYGEVEVTYELTGNGTLYTRAGLNPDLASLAIGGQQRLSERDDGQTYTLATTTPTPGGSRTVAVVVGYADAGHTARRNPSAGDGTASSPRNTAFQHLIELEGDAPGFSFGLRFEVR